MIGSTEHATIPALAAATQPAPIQWEAILLTAQSAW
jgi:hypothetical protein